MANDIRVGFKIGGDNAVLEKINGQVNSLNASSQRLAGANSQALDRILGKVKQVENSTNSSAEKIRKSFESTTSSAGLFNTKLGDITLGSAGLGYTFKQGLDVVAGFFKSSIDEAAKFERSIIGVTSVARNLGEDTGKLKNVILDLTKDGLIPASDAAAALKNLMASGLSLNQSISLFNSLKDAAAFNRQGFLSMGEAVVGASQGIKNQQSIMVDNAGITKNLSIMWKEYAASIGKTVGHLTDAEKAQAAFLGVTKEAALFQGDAERLTKSYAGSLDGLDASVVKLRISVGQYVTESRGVVGVIKDLTDSANLLANLVSNTSNFRDNKKIVEDLKEEISTVDRLGEKYNNLILALPGGEGLKAVLNLYGKSKESDLENVEEFISEAEQKIKDANSRAKFNFYDPADVIIGRELTDVLRGNAGIAERTAITIKKQKEAQDKIDQEAKATAIKKQEEQYAALTKKYQDFNSNKVKELQNAEARELAIAGRNEELRYKIKQSFADKIFEVEKKIADKLNELRGAQDKYEKKLQEEKLKAEKERVRQIRNQEKTTNDFFNNPFSDAEKGVGQTDEAFEKAKLYGRVGGTINSALQGKDGARNLISGAGGLAASMLLGPEAGQVVGPLLNALSQGPEQTRAMVREFAQAIPDLIQAIIESIPVVIEELANQTPVIIERLVEKAPQIIESLVRSAPKVITALALQAPKIIYALAKEMPNIAIQFVGALAKEAPRFVTALIDAINPFGDSEGGFGTTGGGFGGGSWDAGRIGTAVVTGGASEVWNTVSSFFANGGIMSKNGPLPLQMYSNGGIANKPQLAIFGEGRMNEAYVPLPDGKSIPVSLKGNRAGDNELSASLLYEIVALLKNPMTVTSSLSISNRTFGEIILEMNRSNQRMA